MQKVVKFSVVTMLLVFGLTGCKTKALKEQPLKAAARTANFSPLATTPDYVINTAEVKDSILYLNVTYPLACGAKGFDLVADGKMAKSMPPQISANLTYAAGSNANCGGKKKVTEVLPFNLNPLRVNGQSKVILLLNDGKQIEFNYFPFISID
jgi:hypothetical protein